MLRARRAYGGLRVVHGVRLLLEEQRGGLDVVLLGGDVQRGQAHASARVVVDEQRHDALVPLLQRHRQRREPVLRARAPAPAPAATALLSLRTITPPPILHTHNRSTPLRLRLSYEMNTHAERSAIARSSLRMRGDARRCEAMRCDAYVSRDALIRAVRQQELHHLVVILLRRHIQRREAILRTQ